MVKCEKGTCRYGAKCIKNKVRGECTVQLHMHLKGIYAMDHGQLSN